MSQPAEVEVAEVAEVQPGRRPLWSRHLPFLARAPELSRRQWAVLGLVSLASLFDQYDRSLIAMALPQIQAGLGISEGQVGLLASIVQLGSLPALFITLWADRIGRRRALLGTVLAYTALTGASALAPDPRSFIALQFFARVFGTAEMLLAVVVISEEFDPESRGWGIGAFFAIQSCGVGLAAILLPITSSLGSGRSCSWPGCGGACRRRRASRRGSARSRRPACAAASSCRSHSSCAPTLGASQRSPRISSS